MRVRLLLAALIIPIVIVSGIVSLKNPTAFHFGDEDDNFVLGNYVRQGEKVYGTLFAHHQPLGYILSAGVQEVTEPSSLFLLVKRHREALLLWSAVWLILLTWRYGRGVLLFALSFELIKYLSLGNLFLSESLVIYPLLYVLGQLYRQKKLSRPLELVFFGVCIGLIGFLLLPLWPLCLVALGIQLSFQRNWRERGFIGLGLTLTILSVLPFIDALSYLKYSLYINVRYFIPYGSQGNDSISLLAFFAPALTFLSSTGGWLTKSLQLWSGLLFVEIGLLLMKKRYRFVLLVIGLLGLTNLRYGEPGSQYYSGFHQLPWVASLLFTTAMLLRPTMRLSLSKLLKGAMVILLISAVGLAIVTQGENWQQRNGADASYYINYSRDFDIGEAVRIMHDSDDTLLNVPGEQWLVYWQGNVVHASLMINYFSWMTRVPELRHEVDSLFINPQSYPTFFNCECDQHYLEKELIHYQRIKKDGRNTSLYVLPGKLKTLTEEQQSQLAFYRFSF